METLSGILGLFEGNPPDAWRLPHTGPIVVRPNTPLNRQSICQQFETPELSRDVAVMLKLLVRFCRGHHHKNGLKTGLANLTQIAKLMGPTWGPPGSWRPQMDPMLALWILLSGKPWQEAEEHSYLYSGRATWPVILWWASVQNGYWTWVSNNITHKNNECNYLPMS